MQIAVDRSTPKISQSATRTSRARSPAPPLVQRRTTPPARPPAESTRAALEQAFGAEVFAAAGRGVNSTGIPSPVKAKMEAAFRADFSGVRVHQGSTRAAALGAVAYTQGSDIHVAPGHWSPETRAGQALLGHELAHVVQQREGRVQATAQYKGVALNDDPALEAEADTLGARAAAAGERAVQQDRSRAELQPGPSRGTTAPLVQRAITGVIQRVKRKPEVEGLKEKMDELLESIKEQLKKITAHTEQVSPTLDSDDDKDDLEQLNEWVEAAKDGFDAAKNLRDDAANVAERPQGQRPSRHVNQASAHGQSSHTYKEDYWDEIQEKAREVNRLLVNIKTSFPVNAGGFSAAGRAHAMDVEVLNAGTASAGKQQDNSFIEDIEIDTERLTDANAVFKADSRVRTEAAGSRVVLGNKQAGALPGSGLLTQVENNLKPLGAPNWRANFKDTPVPKDRGQGQYANMANTNATGYAWLAEVPGYQQQRWEWLHVRGAGLGGATDGTNLVVGTRDANTHMIPFESNVRILATEAGKNDNYDHLEVDWSVGNPDSDAKHKVETIQMEWKLVKSAGKNVPEPQGKAMFKPLETGANISKKEVQYIEEAIKRSRDTIQP
ncbi:MULTISPECIES: DUF4157 domain-containing protein [Sorangium]|uniref:eCIS core domain-containing protein n=1 Tax=Sorangium cellulosum TaxID=56 RepID=A0A4P2QVK2_SORCE|nr:MULTISPECIES: DUF4157 domain-containing protein [Sorangium]AUX33623.1 uncharacterized protein SOCE836_057840 [Sorangium cellulosum]WCQ92934.1 hypothetical protein NQZ70_05680 [Sorangium sp. Soce836]